MICNLKVAPGATVIALSPAFHAIGFGSPYEQHIRGQLLALLRRRDLRKEQVRIEPEWDVDNVVATVFLEVHQVCMADRKDVVVLSERGEEPTRA